MFIASASPADKRQLQAVVSGQTMLKKKLAAGEVSDDIVAKVDTMVSAIVNKNFTIANSVQMVSIANFNGK